MLWQYLFCVATYVAGIMAIALCIRWTIQCAVDGRSDVL
jgi:hypothetical protein